MSCGSGICGCGCGELVELTAKRSLPVMEETEVCGDGSCGCGCGDLVTLRFPKQKGQEEEQTQ